jgi:hypothetical protein
MRCWEQTCCKDTFRWKGENTCLKSSVNRILPYCARMRHVVLSDAATFEVLSYADMRANIAYFK